MCNLDPVMTMLEQNNDVKIVIDTRTMKDTLALFGGTMPAGSLYAKSEFLANNPRTAQALTNAMVRASKWLQTAGPSDIVKVVPENFLLGDRALYLAAFTRGREALSPDGMFPATGPATALKALQSFSPEIADKKIDLDKTFTNSFVKIANAKYK